MRGLRQRLKEEGIELPPARREKDEQVEDVGWLLEHPLESEAQDNDLRKLVMMSCILAGVRTFAIDRPVMAQFKTPGDASTLEYARYDAHRHIWLRPRNPDPTELSDAAGLSAGDGQVAVWE